MTVKEYEKPYKMSLSEWECPQELDVFWHRWTLLHESFLKNIPSLEKDIDELTKLLLERRNKLFHMLTVMLDSFEESCRSSLRLKIGELLALHDKVFLKLIKDIKEDARKELVHAAYAQKAVQAYARTVQYN